MSDLIQILIVKNGLQEKREEVERHSRTELNKVRGDKRRRLDRKIAVSLAFPPGGTSQGQFEPLM